MDLHRRAFVLSPLVLVCLLAHAAAQAPLAPAPVSLTPAQMEVFLREGKVIARRGTAKGVTKPIQATLSNGTLTHDAQIKAVNESRAIFNAGKASEFGFRDT